MSVAIHLLLDTHIIWRGGKLACTSALSLTNGFAELDAELPGTGGNLIARVSLPAQETAASPDS